MMPFIKSEATKAALITLETQIQAASQRGATALSVYLENFCAKLLEIYYGYGFCNLNYEKKNVKGIDLYNTEYNHAIQITSERNNAQKVVNSTQGTSKYNIITVFFFDHNKTNTICRHLTEKGHWQANLQVISLANIFDDIEQNAEKVELYYELCQLWITDDILTREDLVAILNTEASKKIIANTTSKKYIPEIYIPETDLKKSCRLFACPKLAEKLLFFTAPMFYQGSKYDNLQDVIAVTAEGRKIEFTEDCNIHDLVDIDNPTAEQVKLLLTKLKSYEEYTAISHSTGTYTYKNGTEVLYDEQHSKLESSVRFEISDLLKDFETSQKRYYIVVKDAGQGKTTFLCDFCDTVLFKRNIPTIFINVNQITDSLLAYFERIVSDLIKKDYLSSIELLKQYLSTVGRQLIVVIDGLNESTKGIAFKNEVLEFIRHIDNFGFVKMIATTRHAAYDLYYKSFENESFGSKIAVDIERVYGMGERKSASFKYKILKKYREHFKVSCYISKMAQKKLSNDTLLLRIFCEVFEGDSTAVVNDIFLYKLFKAYIEKRSSQLLALGKIKWIDDLMSLLEKIAKQMLSTDNLDNFSARGFSSDEKDLLDTVVEEDILIKSVENKENPFFNHTLYSFTYDEFRDFLLAMVLLGETDDIFARKVSELSTNYSRYDGLLKYLFLFCKNTGSSKLSALERTDNYNRIYSANIFSVDDGALLDEDVRVITRALETNQEVLYYEICKRLNLTEYKNLSVCSVVQHYIQNYLKSPTEWANIFVKQDRYSDVQHGVLVSILDEKFDSTYPDEVKGILILLSTFTYMPYENEKVYIRWLKSTYPDIVLSALAEIRSEWSLLCEGVERIEYEVNEECE